MARPDFRGTAARRLSEERELSPTIISLLSPEGQTKATSSRLVPVDRIEANPDQPRTDVGRSRPRRARRLDPRAWRPPAGPGPSPRGRSLPARRRRAPLAGRPARAGLQTVPAMIEEIDDDTALEIAIIENLQREDLSPLDEALDVRAHDRGPRLQRPQAGPEAGQGQGLHREPPAPGRCSAGGPAAGVFAQRHPVARLRAAQGRGPAQAPPARRAGRARRAEPGQAARPRRGPALRANEARPPNPPVARTTRRLSTRPPRPGPACDPPRR